MSDEFDLEKILKQLKNELENNRDPMENARLIKKAYALLSERHEFKPGMLVTWKPGLQNKKLPEQKQPAVVVEVLKEPIYDPEQSASSPYFREPLDIILGVLDKDGDFITYYYDSRRFRPFIIAVDGTNINNRLN